MLPTLTPAYPAPSAPAAAHSERLAALITQRIAEAFGWISFAEYMALALHAPGLGYYSAGTRKLGAGGDFVTAPELGRLFGRTLARQVAQCVSHGLTDVLEVGAGSGRLARDLLVELDALGALPRQYLILETSADLKARQRELLEADLPQFAERVTWLETLPENFEGLILGNEVLDAMPVHLIKSRIHEVRELGVRIGAQSGGFAWGAEPASAELREIAHELALPDGYQTEIHLPARAFIRTIAANLARGVALFIDYGFPQREYYHPQRNLGTLMCHYRQRAHDDPFCFVGLQDITAHIDFTAIARTGTSADLDLLGYTTQAQFLINCGLTEVLGGTPAADTSAYLPLASQAQRLTSPAEMGELFKVLALGHRIDFPLLGFERGDKRHAL